MVAGPSHGLSSTLRHKGLDIVLVIDGTKSMDFVMDDVKARMTRLAIRVRLLLRSRASASSCSVARASLSICSR